jgi:hypothetical protein
MRPLAIVGWVLFALDAAFVTMLFVSRNAGDDAAGLVWQPDSQLASRQPW